MQKWPREELALIAERIRANHKSARDSHRSRIDRYRESLRQWHNRVEAPLAGAHQDSNFSVPFTQWVTFSKWSRYLQSLLGDDSEVVAEGNGPTDGEIAAKVGRFMTAAIFRMMPNAFLAFAEWLFSASFFGRGFVYRPWTREVEKSCRKCGEDAVQEGVDGEKPKCAKCGAEGGYVYQGPEMHPIPPEDLVLPAQERARTIQEMSWVHRQYWLDPNDFIDGIEGGVFNLPGVEDEAERETLIHKIIKGAMEDGERSDLHEEDDEVKREESLGEGVSRDFYDDQGLQRIRAWECYLWWRPLREGVDQAAEFEIGSRAPKRVRLVVHYCPATETIIGIRPLSEIYGRMRSPIPISECAVACDGRYWTMGIGHQSFDIQEELSRVYNQQTDAIDMSSFPHMLYGAGSGLDPDKARQLVIGPKAATQVTDVNQVKFLEVRPDLHGMTLLQQSLQGFGEKTLNVSDSTLGRAIDRPNAPRTASGQAMLMEAADVRGWIDLGFMRFWMGGFLRDVWEMYCSMADGEVFFRVTEEEAGGLFETAKGGTTMGPGEFAGRYDFTLKLATSAVSREAKKQQAVELYSLDIQNPLIAMNPRALWMATARVHKALGDDQFERVVPEPPDIDMPLSAKTEHAKMIQGEVVKVNPNDNDQLHLVEHQNAIERHLASPNRDLDYLSRLQVHIQEHGVQLQQKQAMQALASMLGQAMQQQAAMGGGMPPQMSGPQLQQGGMGDVQQEETGGFTGAGADPAAGGGGELAGVGAGGGGDPFGGGGSPFGG